MLIRFRVANFRSLRDEQEFSMVAAFQDGRKELVHIDALGVDLLRVAGIYGANAAGKSNVLDALRFMRNAVRGSHREWPPEGPIPREPFVFEDDLRRKPSRFEADLWIAGVLYTYGFEIDDRRVLQEWLYASPHGRRQLWFMRDIDSGFKFGKQLKGNNRMLTGLTRENSLFLSVAAQNNHQGLFPIYTWFADRLRFTNHENRGRQLSCSLDVLGSQSRETLVGLLRRADLGILDVRKTSDTKDPLRSSLEFYHHAKGGAVTLPLERESHGTWMLLSLAGPILDALENRALVCIDELDSSLHTYLAMEIIHIFQDPERNPNNAQLIFNTHDTTLLGNLLEIPVLHRDQIWFVEKDEEGASHLYSLTDFKPRKFENVERGYLQGRYGAIPFIGPVLVGEDA